MDQNVRTEPALAVELRKVCALLESRIGAGDKCDSESVLAAHPELGNSADAALEVIYTEFVAREQLGQRPEPADFYRRFPRFRVGLEQLFQIHGAAGGASMIPAANASLTPLPDGERLKAIAEPAIDGSLRRIGNYEILGEIGRGGMGVVYKARQVGLNRLVALKMILTGADAGPAERARFREEAESAARLQHSNIVQIYEVGEHEGRPYLSLELVDGGSLEARLNGTPWPAADSAWLVETLARAMQHAHQQGVVHRDLKPANILLLKDESGKTTGETESSFVAKITDFGLARRINADKPELTASGAIVGTPAYMAPEQAAGDAKETGPSADVYALGAILYELLTGRPPFQGVTVLETLEQVRTQEPVPPSRLVPKLPRDIETICLRCLCKVPRQRYGSAAELADDLGRFLHGEPILARPTPVWEKAWKWIKRRPTMASLLAIMVVSTTAGLMSVTYLWRQKSGALETVKKKQSETESALASNLIAQAQKDWLANNIDGVRRLLDECPVQHRGLEWQYLHRMTHSCLRVIDAPGAAISLAWSPDCRLVAGSYMRHMAKIWDLETGREVFDVTGRQQNVAVLTFDSNQSLAMIGWQIPRRSLDPNAPRRLGVKTWDIVTQREISSFFAEIWRYGNPVLSANGRRMAAAGHQDLTVMDVRSGELLSTVPHLARYSVDHVALSLEGRWLAWTIDMKSVCTWDLAVGGPAGPAVSAVSGCVEFSPDGSKLAVARASTEAAGIVEIFERQSGRQVLQLTGHTRGVKCLAFSPDGTRLATGSFDKSIIVWNLLTGKEQFVFRGHQGQISSVTFSPDGNRLASGADKTVRIWDVRPME